MRHFFIWSALLIGLLATLAAVPGRAADPVDNEAIEKLVKQLASGRFAEREKAQKKLEEIGLPALADFSKKTGYSMALLDPENKLKDRKVTLEVAETTFWQAFDQFCEKAGLVEADANEAQQFVPGGPFNGPAIQPGGILLPAQPA